MRAVAFSPPEALHITSHFDRQTRQNAPPAPTPKSGACASQWCPRSGRPLARPLPAPPPASGASRRENPTSLNASRKCGKCHRLWGGGRSAGGGPNSCQASVWRWPEAGEFWGVPALADQLVPFAITRKQKSGKSKTCKKYDVLSIIVQRNENSAKMQTLKIWSLKKMQNTQLAYPSPVVSDQEGPGFRRMLGGGASVLQRNNFHDFMAKLVTKKR